MSSDLELRAETILDELDKIIAELRGAPDRPDLDRFAERLQTRAMLLFDLTAPKPTRHLVEIPDHFVVAHWSRKADLTTICRCILGTLKYEPHASDTSELRRALESVIEGGFEGAAR
jgi:hypothetical protein